MAGGSGQVAGGQVDLGGHELAVGELESAERADRERVEHVEPPAGDPHRLGDVVVDEAGEGQLIQGDAVQDSVAGPLGQPGDSSGVADRRLEAELRQRERRLDDRRAVGQGAGLGDQRVGFRPRVLGAHDPGRAVDVHRHRRQVPRRAGSVAGRDGGVGRQPEQPQGLVADEAAGGRAGGQPQVAHPLGDRRRELGGLLVAPLRLRRPAAEEQQRGELAGQLRGRPPSRLVARGPRERGARRRRRAGRTGRTRTRRCPRRRSGPVPRRPAGTTARGRPGAGPARPPRPAARRRTGGSSPAPGTWSVRRAGRPAGCARRGGPTRRRPPPARGHRRPRRRRCRRRTTTRTRRRRAAAPGRRPRAGRSSSRWPPAASACRSGRPVPAVRNRSRWSRPASSPSSPSVGNRAAASSMASAMPSSARHSAATRAGSGGPASPVAAATRAANRSTASPPPPTTDSPGTTYTRSYGSSRRVRLVASTVTSGQPVTIRSTQARTPSDDVLAVVQHEQPVPPGERGDQGELDRRGAAARGRRPSRRPPR